jgi:hypothetical protein
MVLDISRIVCHFTLQRFKQYQPLIQLFYWKFSRDSLTSRWGFFVPKIISYFLLNLLVLIK